MKDPNLPNDEGLPNKNVRPLISLHYYITKACNVLNCIHCAASPTPQPHPDELTTEEWNRISDEGRAIGAYILSISGGEPLMRPDLDDIVEHASNLGYDIRVISNCYSMTEKRMDTLIDRGANTFVLSLDGIDAETHDTFRGQEGLYDRVIQAIKMASTKDVQLIVSTVLTTMNMDQIVDLMDMLDGMGVNHLDLLRIQQLGNAAKNPHLFPTDEDYIRIIPKINKKSHEIKTMKVSLPTLGKDILMRSFGKDTHQDMHRKGKIILFLAGVFSMQIDPFGDVRPRFVVDDFNLGNVRKQSLEEIWNSEKAIRVGELIMKASDPFDISL